MPHLPMSSRTKRRRFALLVSAGVLVTANIWPTAAGAAVTPAWDVVDPAGDANGLSFALDPTPDTTPVSDSRADLRRVRMETTYDTVTERSSTTGAVTAIRHIPRSLLITVQTSAPARPATGPTAWFVLSTRLGNCYPGFGFKIRGPLSTTEDEAPEITDRPPDGVTVGSCFRDDIRHPRFTVTFQGDTARMDFPFDALAESAEGAQFAVGAELQAGAHRPAFIRTFDYGSGGNLLLGVIDAAPALTGSYVIGSDVPDDIDCTATPSNPACRA